MKTAATLLGFFLVLGYCSPAQADPLAETGEIVWSNPEELDLLAKATELASAPAIYEYVRNNFEYALYSGARSDSTNTFLFQRGNDVDIASVLIAMLRSQGIPARYATGSVVIRFSDLASWLQVIDDYRAANAILQLIDFSAAPVGGSALQFKHVWVQAQVPFAHYRAAGLAAGINCSAHPEQCTWVDLDPSFKLHDLPNPAELVDVASSVFFDYDGYYNAENDAYPPPADGIQRRHKGPLQIYEEQLTQYLRGSPETVGKTLEDVVYRGPIATVSHGILPASLPYAVVGAVATYDSVAEHDAATTDWKRVVSVTINFPEIPQLASVSLTLTDPIAISGLSTKDLTLSFESTDFEDSSVPKKLVARLGGQIIEELCTITDGIFTYSGGSVVFTENPPDVGSPFDMHVEMDSNFTGGTISVDYPRLMLGGYYLVATGGETSNASQVRRAARRLLQATQDHPTIEKRGVLYVDVNKSGSVDEPDVPLLEHADAQVELTGGVLAVAKALYYARLREEYQRVNDLQHSMSPATGYLGVLSSVHDVHAVEGTAFSIIPVGLLIDMKGIIVYSAKKIDEPDTKNEHSFRLGGHIASSLEHEIWQEITGYETISTMQGIQKTVAHGSQLMLLEESQSQLSLSTALANWGFEQTLPPGFASDDLDLFGLRLWLPRTDTSGPDRVIDVIRETIDVGTSELRKKAWALSVDEDGSAFEDFFREFENVRDQLAGWPPGDPVDPPFQMYPDPGCITSSNAQALLDNLDDCFFSVIARPEFQAYEDYVGYFDKNSGFVAAEHLYRAFDPDAARHISSLSLAPIRDEVALGVGGGDTVEYVIPEEIARGELLDFAVWIRRVFDSVGYEFETVYAINRAGGGYVSGADPIDIYDPLDPWWNNELFYEDGFSSSTNNSAFTPSTGDPVSTITGNMYLDETDISIRGRGGLDYRFTRTYNSLSSKESDPGVPMGHGWTHSYNARLIARDHGREPDSDDPENTDGIVSSITYVDERGGEHVFSACASGDLIRITGDGEGGPDRTTGWRLVECDLGVLSAGSHTVTIGGYNNKKTYSNESTEILIDDVVLERTRDSTVIIEAHFDAGPDGFAYVDDPFETSEPVYASGSFASAGGFSGGGLQVDLGNVDNSAVVDGMSGGWWRSFSLGSAESVTVSFRYRLTQTGYYETDEYSEMLASVDGAVIRSDLLSDWRVSNPRGNFDALDLSEADSDLYTLRFRNGIEYVFGDADLSQVDAIARLQLIRDPYGNELDFQYDAGGRLVEIQDNLGVPGRTGLALAYNAADRLKQITDWTGRTWTYTYDEWGHLTGAENPLGDVTTYHYAPDPNVTEQRSFSEGSLVSSLPSGARAVFAADADGDGDLDVFTGSLGDRDYAWYENTDGQGTFGPRRLVADRDDPAGIYVADLDGDGDNDALSASTNPYSVVWYENLDGAGTFGPQQVLGSGPQGVLRVAAADLDGDTDLDVVFAATYNCDSEIGWFENLGSGSFGALQPIASSTGCVLSIALSDLDGDGDHDVVTAEQLSHSVLWYENTDGGGSFGPARAITTSQISANSVVPADLDEDGDLDVLVTGYFVDEVAWYENLGSGTFGPQQLLTDQALTPTGAVAADVDGDGDLDVLSASRDDDTVAWHENHGGGNFGPRQVISDQWDRPYAIHAGDLDGDGNADVVVAHYVEGVYWWGHASLTQAERLAEIVWPADRDGDFEGDVRTTFGYYANGRCFRNANSFGQGEQLDYDLFRKRTRITDPRGFVTAHFFDENGELTEITRADGAVLAFKHNPDGRRWEKTDALGFSTQYSYCEALTLDGCVSDAGGNVTLEKDPLGKTLEYEYDTALFDAITRIKDKREAELVFTYYDHTDGTTGAAKGKLETVAIKQLTTASGIHSDVVLERYFYYDNGNLKRHIEYFDLSDPAKTRITRYIYNDSGLNPAEIVPEDIIVEGWDGETSRNTREIDALGRVTSETLYRRTSYSDATQIALTTQYEYDDLDRVTLITDPALNQERRIYDANGQLTEVQRRFWLESSSSYPYNWDKVVRRKYDPADRMIEERDVNDALTTYEYDEAGNVIQVTGPTGETLRYEYDAMNRRTAVIDENGHRWETVYDLPGRPVKLIDPTGIAVENEYDENGRLLKVKDPQLSNQTQFEYDGEGNLTKMIDANASEDASLLNSYDASEYREYDELGRVVRIVDALDNETLFAYDLLGNVTSVTDAEGNVTTFEYDGLGRLETAEPPGAGALVTTHEYDEAGNRIYTKYRSGAEEVVDYDEINRPVTSTILGTGNVHSWTYDDRERLETIGNADVSYGFAYDLKNRLETRTDSRLPSQPVTYEYDAADRLMRKTDFQGDVTEFDYDGTGRLVGERNAEYLHVSYQYDGAGRVLRRILSNGARTEYAYDAGGRLAKLVNLTAGGALLQEIEYTERDRVGNVKQMTITHADGRVEVADFEYDRVHRLEEAVYKVDSVEVERQNFTYDAVGNRKTKTSTLAGGQTHHYFYNERSQLTDIRLGSNPTDPLVHHFEYDDNGNMTSRSDAGGSPELVLHYDDRDRVTSIDVGGAEVARYKYDPLGYRIENDGAAGVRRSVLEAEHLEAVYGDQGSVRAKFLRGTVIDEVVNASYFDAQGKESNFTYHHDTLQSVVGLSDHAGTVEQTLRYGPFGELLEQGGSSPSTLRFTGREFDAETGLYYYRARYYDPGIGRFLSEDPLGFGARDVNLYTYVGNNPLRFNDPSGNIPVPIALGLIVGGGAAIGTVIAGGDLADVGLAFGAGFVAGATFGYGTTVLAGAAAVGGQTAAAAAVTVGGFAATGGAANSLNQFGQMYITGSRDSFSYTEAGAATALSAFGAVPAGAVAAGSARAIALNAGQSLDLSLNVIAGAHGVGGGIEVGGMDVGLEFLSVGIVGLVSESTSGSFEPNEPNSPILMDAYDK